MPNTVNMVTPEGVTVVVPAEEIKARTREGYRAETSLDYGASRAQGAADTKRDQLASGGLESSLQAAGAGFARGATFGLSDLVLKDIGVSPEKLSALQEKHNVISGVSEFAGALAPALASGGTGTAASIARALPAGASARLGARIAAVGGGGILASAGSGAAEGLLQAGGMHISEAVLADKPLSAEGFVASGLGGALFGGGAGAAFGLAEKGFVSARKLWPKHKLTTEAIKKAGEDVDTQLTAALSAGEATAQSSRDALHMMRLQNAELDMAAQAKLRQVELAEAQARTAAAEYKAGIHKQKLATQAELDSIRIAKAKAPGAKRGRPPKNPPTAPAAPEASLAGAAEAAATSVPDSAPAAAPEVPTAAPSSQEDLGRLLTGGAEPSPAAAIEKTDAEIHDEMMAELRAQAEKHAKQKINIESLGDPAAVGTAPPLPSHENADFIAQMGQKSGPEYTDIWTLWENNSYSDIQRHARVGDKPEFQSAIDQLDDLTSSGTIPRDVTVYRGINNTLNTADLVPGALVRDGGFTAVSTSRDISDEFARKTYYDFDDVPYNNGIGTMFEIVLPKGQKGAWVVSDFNQYNPADSLASEILLGRNTGFRVQSVEMRGNTRVVKAVAEMQAPTKVLPIHEVMAELDPTAKKIVDATKAQEAAADKFQRRFTIKDKDGTTKVSIPEMADLTVGRVKQAYGQATAPERAEILKTIGPQKAEALTGIFEGEAKFAKWYQGANENEKAAILDVVGHAKKGTRTPRDVQWRLTDWYKSADEDARQALLAKLSPERGAALAEVTDAPRFTDWFKNKDHWDQDLSYAAAAERPGPSPEDLGNLEPRVFPGSEGPSRFPHPDDVGAMAAPRGTVDVAAPEQDVNQLMEFVHQNFSPSLQPQDVLHGFAAPSGFKTVLKEVTPKKGMVRLSMEIVEDGTGEVAGRLERAFKSDGSVHNTLMFLEPKYRKSGIGSFIHDNSIDMYKSMGASKVDLKASGLGRYTWAKRGFAMENPEMARDAIGNFVRTHVPANRQAEAARLIEENLGNPQKLAQLDDGSDYALSFGTLGGKESGSFKLGKAFLLSDSLPMWAGSLDLASVASKTAKQAENVAGHSAADLAELEDLQAALRDIGDYERAVADTVAALGPSAPPQAQELAARYTAALDDQARKMDTRAAQVFDDMPSPSAAPAELRAQAADEAMAGPALQAAEPPPAAAAATPAAQPPLAEALGAKPPAAAMDARKAAGLISLPGAATAPVKRGGALGLLADVGTGIEALQMAGINLPFMPRVENIPVIGPIAETYLKLRALAKGAKKLGFNIPFVGEARVAAGSAKTQERIAEAMDGILSMGSKAAAKGRAVVAPQTWRAADVLKAVLYHDGEKRHPGTDLAAIMRARTDELLAAQANPAGVRAGVRQALKDVANPDVIDAVTAVAERRINYLAKHAPMAPPPTLLGRNKWDPSRTEMERFARRVRACNDPVSVLKDIESGVVTGEAVEALREVYPRLYDEARARLVERAPVLAKNLPGAVVVRLGALFDAPLSSSLEPAKLRAIQAAGKPKALPPGPPGAPPAPPPSAMQPPPAGAPNLSKLYQTAAQRRE